MKILPPVELERKRKEEESNFLHRLSNVQEVLKRETANLNIARDIAKIEKEKLETEFQNTSKELSDRKAKLRDEVDELERQKAESLKPITEELHELHSKIEEVALRESIVSEKEINVHQRELEVQDQSSKLIEKENSLSSWEETLKEREKKTTNYEIQISVSGSNLANEWELFKNKSERYDLEFQEKEAAMRKREDDARIREEELGRASGKLIFREKTLRDLETVLNKRSEEINKK